jgi:hypothetical protein
MLMNASIQHIFLSNFHGSEQLQVDNNMHGSEQLEKP